MRNWKSRTIHRTGRMCICWITLISCLFLGGTAVVKADSGPGGSLRDDAAITKQIYETLASGQRVEADARTYKTPEKPTVYLTFDDGPSKLTGQVLDILAREQIRATFFVLGEQAQKQKALLRRMSDEGHTIGNHTYNHVYQQLYTSFAAFRDQVEKTDGVLLDATGRKPEVLRAPGGTYGNFDPFYFYYLEEAGYTVFDWNVDTRDAAKKGATAEDIVKETKASPLKHELVVLMHDGTGHEESVKALPEVIAYYRAKGYVFAPLSRDVKPVQFTSVKNKWSRSYTYDSFADETKLAILAGRERMQALYASGTAGNNGKQTAGQAKEGKGAGQEGEWARDGSGVNRGGEGAADGKSADPLGDQAKNGRSAARGEEKGGLSVGPAEGTVKEGQSVGPAEGPAKGGLSVGPAEGTARGGLSVGPAEGMATGLTDHRSLIVRMGTFDWLVDPSRYDLHFGRFAVPLRAMMELLGGIVEWNEETRTAAVTLGGKRLEVDPIRKIVKEYTLGQQTKLGYLADVRLAGGEIRVPLQETAKFFGGTAAGFAGEEKGRMSVLLYGGSLLRHFDEAMLGLRRHEMTEFASL